MTLFIVYPKADHTAFSKVYLATTGEAIQDNPEESINGLCMVGSSRLTQEQADKLTAAFPSVKISDAIPADWVLAE